MPAEFLKQFIEKTPPYKKENLDTIILSYISGRNFPKIEVYCLNCEKEKTFNPRTYSTSDVSVVQISNYLQVHSKIPYICFLIEYRCTQCGAIHTYTIKIDNDTIVKTGQYPSFAELSNRDAEKYKNVLSKYYIEFKRSLSAYSQSMGAASFVYLRRILEDIVEKKYAKLEHKNNEIKFLDKLKAVEKVEIIIPKEIETLKGQIYSILSKGVHEYSEDECLEMYEPVKFIIELILDKQLEEKARKDKTKNYSALIANKLGASN